MVPCDMGPPLTSTDPTRPCGISHFTDGKNKVLGVRPFPRPSWSAGGGVGFGLGLQRSRFTGAPDIHSGHTCGQQHPMPAHRCHPHCHQLTGPPAGPGSGGSRASPGAEESASSHPSPPGWDVHHGPCHQLVRSVTVIARTVVTSPALPATGMVLGAVQTVNSHRDMGATISTL
jgi:hypothetical protein